MDLVIAFVWGILQYEPEWLMIYFSLFDCFVPKCNYIQIKAWNIGEKAISMLCNCQKYDDFDLEFVSLKIFLLFKIQTRVRNL